MLNDLRSLNSVQLDNESRANSHNGLVICDSYDLSGFLDWNDGEIFKFAKKIYHSRNLTDLPILADLLEDAGCTDNLALWHLRSNHDCLDHCHVVDGMVMDWTRRKIAERDKYLEGQQQKEN